MTEASRSPRQFAELIEDVFRLRSLIKRSRSDAALAESHQFIYFVDPAILDLYTEPEAWAPRIAALPSLHRDAGQHHSEEHSGSNDPILNATALLTGEFIFSSGLVGSDGWLYIAPEHLDDFFGHILKIERKYNIAVHKFAAMEHSKDDPYQRLRHRLAGQEAAFGAQGFNESEWLARIREILVEELSGVASHAELLAPHRLCELLDRDVLAHGTIHPLFTDDVIAPGLRPIGWWQTQIAKSKAHNRRKATSEAIEADAVTLEQLRLLNADHASTRTLHLLISGDHALHVAYGHKCRDEPDTFFPLRHPAQYVPILNVKDMGGEFESSAAFDQLERSVNGICALFSSTDSYVEQREFAWQERELRHLLLSDVGRKAALVNAQDIEAQIQDISSTWYSLLSLACSAKADVIGEAVERQSDYWQRFAGSKVFRREFTKTAGTLRDQFAGLTEASALLRQEIWAIEARARDQPDTYGRRALSTNFANFTSSSIRDQSIQQVLQRLGGSGAAALLRSISKKQERLFVVGALCLEIGAWAGALNLLTQAEERARTSQPSDIGKENSYLRCIALRLAATPRTWAAQYETAQENLRLLLDEAENPFDRARFTSEMIALQLCAVAWRYSETVVLRSDAQRIHDLIDRFFSSDIARQGKEGDDPGRLALTRQLALNVLNAAFWCRVILGVVPDPLVTQSKEAFSRLETLSSRLLPGPHMTLYPLFARIALATSEEAVVLKREALEGIDRLLNADRESGFAFDMPFVDKVELRKIKSLLGSESTVF